MSHFIYYSLLALTQTFYAVFFPLVIALTYVRSGLKFSVVSQKLSLYFKRSSKKYWIDYQGPLNKDLIESFIQCYGLDSIVLTTAKVGLRRQIKKNWPQLYVTDRPLNFTTALSGFWLHTNFRAYIAVDKMPSAFSLLFMRLVKAKSFILLTNYQFKKRQTFYYKSLKFLSIYRHLTQAYCRRTSQKSFFENNLNIREDQLELLAHLGEIPCDKSQSKCDKKLNLLEQKLFDRLKKKKNFCLYKSTAEDENFIFQNLLGSSQSPAFDHILIYPEQIERSALMREHLLESQQSVAQVKDLDVSFALPKIIIIDKDSLLAQAAQCSELLLLGASFSYKPTTHPIELLTYSKKIISGRHLQPFEQLSHRLEQQGFLSIYDHQESFVDFCHQAFRHFALQEKTALQEYKKYYYKLASLAPTKIQSFVDES